MRKKKKVEPEGSNWLTTFSDLMTLLMLFFVLQYAMASGNGMSDEERGAIITSIEGAFSGGSGILFGGSLAGTGTGDGSGNGDGLGDGEGKGTDNGSGLTIDFGDLDLDEIDLDDVIGDGTDEQTLREVLEYIVNGYLVVQGLSSEVAVEYIDEGILLQLQDYILFESASAELKPESIDVLKRLGTLFAQFEGEIRIVGHTDNIPIGTTQFPSNWELGLARATAIVRHYERQGFEGSRFVPSTRGDTVPIASNDTEEGRAKNRRVNFLIEATPEDVSRLQDLIAEYEDN